MTSTALELTQYIRDIPDFPKPGILFKDITPLLANHQAFNQVVDAMADHYRSRDISAVVGIESRGFIFGAPLALRLGAGFVPVRKPGKLPFTTERLEYALEYGTDALEIHIDAVVPPGRIVICDDLLATGGTVAATKQLVEKIGGEVVGLAFLIELTFLDGRSKLGDTDVFSLIRY
ncbi:MAG TPA: adenine phosphoribosyltransferase [bacterium]|nr:adenine phosphoribosyltransferase [bacterium]